MVAILTSPSLGKIDYISFELFKNLNQKPVIIVLNSEDDERKRASELIDGVFEDIEKNTRYLSDLLKERESLLAQIETKMDLYSMAKVSLSDEQIDNFANFMSYSSQSKNELKELLMQIDTKRDLSEVTKEILHIDTDYEFVYSELDVIRSFQYKAIDNLNDYITSSNIVLENL